MVALPELPALNQTRFPFPRFVLETGSTNADLLVAAADGAPEGDVLVADHQTAGRGRQAREWHDDPGNALLVSFLVRPDRVVAPLLPLLTGVAVCEAMSHLDGSTPPDGPVGLKWPNDVLVPALGERKVAGILAESAVPTGRGVPPGVGLDRLVVVVGTGINLRWVRQPPPEVAARAATVTEALGREVDRDQILDLYLRCVDRWLAIVEDSGTDQLLDRYRSLCLTLGREVRFVTATAEHHGTAVAITERGTLILDTASDGPVELHAGDAHHVAPGRP